MWKFHSVFCLVFCFSCYHNTNSASGNTDSLLTVISHLPDNEKKAESLLELGWLLHYSHSDSARGYYQDAAALSAGLGYKEGLADAWYRLSLISRREADLSAAQDYLDKYLEVCFQLQDSARIAKGYFQQAGLFLDANRNELALVYARKSLESYLPLQDTNALVAIYNRLGSIHKAKAAYETSAFYYLEAVRLSESLGNEPLMATIYKNLGDAYLMARLPEAAKKYLDLALEIDLRLPNRERGLAITYNNLGRLAAEQERFADAAEYYGKSSEYYGYLNDREGQLYVLNNLGDLYFRQRNFDQALQYFDLALQGYVDLGLQTGILTALGNKAAVYTQTGRYNRAIALHDSCLALAYRDDNRELRMDALWNLSDTYREMGNFTKSHEYLMRHYVLKDSLFNIKSTEVINDLLLKYEKEKDQARIHALEFEDLRKDLILRKRTSQRNIVTFTALAVVALGVFIMLYLRQRAVKDRIIARQKIRQLEEEKKLMAAKLLVEGQEKERKRIARELHDGLGVLLSATKMQFTSIMDKSPENRPLIEKATRLIEEASRDVRKISHNMMPGLLTKLGFYEAVEDLIENIDDTADISATCEITGEQERLPENKEIMLYRIVQEIVNNTLKHAQAKDISLKISITPGKLIINYSDNGKGFDAEKILLSEEGAFGLKSLQSRVGFLNGSMDIESSPGQGTRYFIEVPV